MLLALAVILLTVTLMACSVIYINDLPTKIVGPSLFEVIMNGCVYKYVRDADTWREQARIAMAEE